MFQVFKVFSVTLIWITFAYSQSMLNSLGMGNPGLYKDVASAGLSSSGLIPGYRNDISIMNPSTWASSRYTLFSSTLNGVSRFIHSENIENQHSNLNWMAFIVPFKDNYAFGIGFFPYTDFNINYNSGEQLSSKNENTFFGTEALYYSGGVSSLRFAFGFPLKSFGKGGWALDLLFGSMRSQKSIEIDDETYIVNRRKMINGIESKLFLSSNEFIILSYRLNLFLNLGFTFRNFTAEVLSYQPFIDINNNSIHDISLIDFPGIDRSQPPTSTHYNNFYRPIDINLGIRMRSKSDLYYFNEWGIWKNNQKSGSELFDFGDAISTKFSFAQGLIRYSKEFPQNILDKFNWRTGYSISQLKFQNNFRIVDQIDLSFGVGLPFGKYGNQIDIAYVYTKLNGGYLINESVNSIQIGLTIGDIWFVKRRNR